MSESSYVQKYLVRDPQGSVYGPADMTMLRQWVLEGRIVAGMSIAPQETREWMEASQHPAVADMLQVVGEPAAHEVSPEERRTAIVQRPVPACVVPASQPLAQRPIPAQPVDLVPAIVPQVNTLGMLSLIFGCVGILTGCVGCIPLLNCIGIPATFMFELSGLTLGVLALNQFKAAPILYRGRGMAVAGTTISSIFLGIYVLVVILIFLLNR